MLLSVCPASQHPATAGIFSIRQALAYKNDRLHLKKFVFSRIILRVPNKMSEGERYIIAKTQILVKGRWHADQ